MPEYGRGGRRKMKQKRELRRKRRKTRRREFIRK
jgi:hypothetical protein